MLKFVLGLILVTASAQTLPTATYQHDLAWDHFEADTLRPGFVQQFKMDGQPAEFVPLTGATPVVLASTPPGKVSYRTPVSTALPLGQHRLELRACATAADGVGLDCGPVTVFDFIIAPTATSNAPAGPSGLRFIPRSGGG
jgi:hypothetical protein